MTYFRTAIQSPISTDASSKPSDSISDSSVDLSLASLCFRLSTFHFLALDSLILASTSLIFQSFSAVVIGESLPITFYLLLNGVYLIVTTASIAFFCFVNIEFFAQSWLEVWFNQLKYIFTGLSIAAWAWIIELRTELAMWMALKSIGELVIIVAENRVTGGGVNVHKLIDSSSGVRVRRRSFDGRNG